MTRLFISPETTLRCGDLAVTLAPAAGGRITRLVSTRGGTATDWLVPLDDATREAGFEPTAWPKAGCYPLLPFSNRIRQGAFSSAGRTALLPLHPGERHALHGGAQQRPWRITAQEAGSATMAYSHDCGQQGWPWSYRAEQVVTLGERSLTLEMRVTNTDDAEMPCGMGFHPYIPARFAHRISFQADAVWAPDAEFLATAPEPVSAGDDYATPRALADAELTQYYGAWHGEATLASADGAAIHLVGDTALRHLVLHRPLGRGYFCVEPVSHVANAAHLQARHPGTGWLQLPPGASAACRMVLQLTG
ncbi:MAG: aldose epimerase [Rhodoferax sp.]|nr:aldose epimerase [Rhodoferax sp.]